MLGDNLKKQLEVNEAWCVANGIVDMPLKAKYRTKFVGGFGKHGGENSGGVGRRARARKRHPVPRSVTTKSGR